MIECCCGCGGLLPRSSDRKYIYRHKPAKAVVCKNGCTEVEVWLVIKGFPVYEVSNKGRVRGGVKPDSETQQGRILKPNMNNWGYLKTQKRSLIKQV